MQKKQKDEIVYMEIGKLKESPNNANIHPEGQITKLMKSIKRFGFKIPVLIDKKNMIVAGHARVVAAKRMGLKEIPTIPSHFKNDKEKRGYMLADNRIAEDSDLDPGIMLEEFEFLKDDQELLEAAGLEAKDSAKMQSFLDQEDSTHEAYEAEENEGHEENDINEDEAMGSRSNSRKLTTCPECGHEF